MHSAFSCHKDSSWIAACSAPFRFQSVCKYAIKLRSCSSESVEPSAGIILRPFKIVCVTNRSFAGNPLGKYFFRYSPSSPGPCKLLDEYA